MESSAASRDGRIFTILLGVTFITITATNAIRPTVTYHALGLGADAVEVGLVQSAFSILPALTAVFMGRRIDRAGERWYMVWSLVSLALGAAIAAVSGSLIVLAAGQTLMGFGVITMLIAGQAMVANRGPRGDRDRRYGTYTTVMAVGQLLGPAFAATVLATFVGRAGESYVFLAAAMAFSVAAAASLAFPSEPSRPSNLNADEPSPSLLRSAGTVLGRPGMPAAMFVSVVVVSTVDVLAAYLPVYGESAGLSVALVGALLSIRAGATLVSRIFMLRLIAWLGRQRLLAVSLAISALGLGLIPFTTVPIALVVLMVLGGFALGMGQPMTIAWVANRSTRRDRATALGVRLTGNRAALLVVPSAMGLIAGAAGVSAIFWAIAALLGAGAAVALAMPGDPVEPDADTGPAISDDG